MSTIPLPTAHLALSAVFLLWNIVVGGRVAQQSTVPRLLAALSALGGLLVAPALLVLIASASLVTGRALQGIAWLWPIIATLVAAQAFYATATRRASPLIGGPIVVYDVAVAAAALARYFVEQGNPPPGPMMFLLAGSTLSLERVAGSAAALSALHTPIPLLAPALPARWRIVSWWRGAVTAVAIGWIVLLGGAIGAGRRAVRGYETFSGSDLRPGGAFSVGLEILPPLAGVPPPAAMRSDLDLLGDSEVGAVLVTISTYDVANLALDSVRRALEPFRRDGLVLLAALRPPSDLFVAVPRTRTDPAAIARTDSSLLAVAERVARRLRPDYILPVDGTRGVERAPRDAVTLGRLQRLLHDANATVRRADDRIRIGLGIVPASASDSILYAWAASPSSPVAAVGFTLVAGPGGAPLLDARLANADRWMQSTGSAKEHWVFRAGGIPSVHGDEAQGLAIERILGWAMAHPGMRGAIVTHAADYGTGRGLRAASGRVRPGFAVVVRAVRETSR